MPRIVALSPFVLALALASGPALAVDDAPPAEADMAAWLAAGVPGDDPAILATVDPRLGREPPPPEVADPQQALVWERREAPQEAPAAAEAPPRPERVEEGHTQR